MLAGVGKGVNFVGFSREKNHTVLLDLVRVRSDQLQRFKADSGAFNLRKLLIIIQLTLIDALG